MRPSATAAAFLVPDFLLLWRISPFDPRGILLQPIVLGAKHIIKYAVAPLRIVLELRMAERWLGIVVSSDRLIIVDAEVDGASPITVEMDATWALQEGDRPQAYRVMHQRLVNYARENRIRRAVIKGSAVSLRGTKKVHLEAAELRGVVSCALAEVADVTTPTKALISRTFGDRKVDAYIKDDKFWRKEIGAGQLRNGSREAAMVILAARP
jgi:hypothetical protein